MANLYFTGDEVQQLGTETVADNVSNSSCLALSKQTDLSGTDGLFQDPNIEEGNSLVTGIQVGFFDNLFLIGGEVEHPCAEDVAVNITNSSCLASSKQTDLSGTDGLLHDPNIEDGNSLKTGIQVVSTMLAEYASIIFYCDLYRTISTTLPFRHNRGSWYEALSFNSGNNNFVVRWMTSISTNCVQKPGKVCTFARQYILIFPLVR
jgi:hypothetical protein